MCNPQRVWVLGAGSMGSGIAQLAAQAGHAVCLYGAQAPAIERAMRAIAADLDGAVSRGKLSAEQRQDILARISPSSDLAAGQGSSIVIEAIVGDLSAKQALLRSVEALVDEDALLLSNTSSISVTAIAAALRHPERMAGWHFFNPPARMKLVAIIPGVQTATSVAEVLQALSLAWGKTAVVAPHAPGFIVNRVARPSYYAEAWRLLAERAAPASVIDTLMQQAGGFALNEAADLVSWNAVRSADIDVAMRLGTAYPRGPLAWGRTLGASRVFRVLRHLFDHYGDARYRIAPKLSNAHWSGVALDV